MVQTREHRREVTRNDAYERASELYISQYVDEMFWEAVDDEMNINFYFEDWTLEENVLVIAMSDNQRNICIEATFRESEDSKPCYLECGSHSKKLNLDWTTTDEFMTELYALVGRELMNR